jgi:hypothetical protein
VSDHADIVREESAWLADYADYGIRATEDQGGIVDGDADSHRAALVAALDALVAERDEARSQRDYETAKAQAAEAERDALAVSIGFWEAEVARLREAQNPDVIEERHRQDQVWGQQEHDDPLWLAILTEEVGEAAEGVLHEIFGGHAVTRREVVQVAAVALAWIECIDRRAALAKEGTP